MESAYKLLQFYIVDGNNKQAFVVEDIRTDMPIDVTSLKLEIRMPEDYSRDIVGVALAKNFNLQYISKDKASQDGPSSSGSSSSAANRGRPKIYKQDFQWVRAEESGIKTQIFNLPLDKLCPGANRSNGAVR